MLIFVDFNYERITIFNCTQFLFFILLFLASQDFVSETKLKGDEDFIFESDYYSSYGTPRSEEDSNYEYTTRNNCGVL